MPDTSDTAFEKNMKNFSHSDTSDTCPEIFKEKELTSDTSYKLQ